MRKKSRKLDKELENEANKLSSRERQIMDVIYSLGEAAASDIQKALPDELANATIRTMLRILETKGYLQHRTDGRTFIYFASRPKEQMAKSAIKRLLGVFFNDSVPQAVSGLLQIDDVELGAKELDELEKIVSEAKKKRGLK